MTSYSSKRSELDKFTTPHTQGPEHNGTRKQEPHGSCNLGSRSEMSPQEDKKNELVPKRRSGR
jgi:hypothetical protein